ncbi:homeobox protein Hox-A5 [Crotalus adamanteus]|uniref:Homeobox protein Hox-A5 n=1 Tax=Crotalus adamanteus TaxID=8729 RepID=A0AAW1B0W3_CROAD
MIRPQLCSSPGLRKVRRLLLQWYRPQRRPLRFQPLCDGGMSVYGTLRACGGNYPSSANTSEPPRPPHLSAVKLITAGQGEATSTISSTASTLSTSSGTAGSNGGGSATAGHLGRKGLSTSPVAQEDPPANSEQATSQWNDQNAVQQAPQPHMYPWMTKLHISHGNSMPSFLYV